MTNLIGDNLLNYSLLLTNPFEKSKPTTTNGLHLSSVDPFIDLLFF